MIVLVYRSITKYSGQEAFTLAAQINSNSSSRTVLILPESSFLPTVTTSEIKATIVLIGMSFSMTVLFAVASNDIWLKSKSEVEGWKLSAS